MCVPSIGGTSASYDLSKENHRVQNWGHGEEVAHAPVGDRMVTSHIPVGGPYLAGCRGSA